jgi:hypothetical protein
LLPSSLAASAVPTGLGLLGRVAMLGSAIGRPWGCADLAPCSRLFSPSGEMGLQAGMHTRQACELVACSAATLHASACSTLLAPVADW